ncbi:MAG: MarR family winged helix-turn-helix transcriptional regulator [Solirubrobacteraceae bacterium]
MRTISEASAGSISTPVTAAAGGAVPAHVTVLIARIARNVRQRFEQVLTPLGLRQRHLVALSYLRGHGPTAQQNLADRLRMDASSMVCLLNDLEENQLVVRHRDRTDRRRGLVELSERGEQALSEMDTAVQVVEDEILGGLELPERQLLRDLLARLDVGEADWGLIADEA